MTREQAIPYIAYCIDDALSERDVADMPPTARLVGWQCGFEPLFVAVWSYLDKSGDECLFDMAEAEEIAKDFLLERKWFSDPDADNDADYIL